MFCYYSVNHLTQLRDARMTAIAQRPSIDQLRFRIGVTSGVVPPSFAVTMTVFESPRVSARLTLGTSGHVLDWHSRTARVSESVLPVDMAVPSAARHTIALGSERILANDFDAVRIRVIVQAERLTADDFVHVHDEYIAGTMAGVLHRYDPHHRIGLTPLTWAVAEPVVAGMSLAIHHTFPAECAIVKVISLFERIGG
jgi:hypothetical protein